MAEFISRDVPPGLRQVLNDEQEREIFKNFADSQADNNKILSYIPREMEFDNQRSVLQAPKTHLLNRQILSSCILLKPDLKEHDYSWDAVLDTIQAAKEAYQSKAKTNFLRRILRKGEPAAQFLISACEMIPDDNGLSAIRAGLVIIFQTWQKRVENVGRILSALGDLPCIFSQAVDVWTHFRDNTQLKIAIHDLGKGILDGIDDLISILQRRSKHHDATSRRILNPGGLMKTIPQNEAIEISQILSRVEEVKLHFIHRVDVLEKQRSASMERKADQTLQTTQANREATFQNRQVIRQTGHDILSRVDGASEDIKAQIQETRNEVANLTKLVKGDLAKGSERLPENVVVFSNLTLQILLENVYKEKCQPTNSTRGHPIPRYPLMSLTTLMEVINVPRSSPITDRDEVLKKSRTFKDETLGRGRWLLTMESFKNFVSPSSSGLLLVDGCCGDLCDGKVSPLSVICATLAATLDQTQSHVVLHFFCGRHCRPKDALSGPRGLMESLIYQIIIYPDLFDPKFDWESKVTREQLANGDLAGLCSIFKQLIGFVNPQYTVYCILDGISEFETSLNGWLDQLKEVFQVLRGLTANTTDPQTGPYFKLLMTSAEKSTRISRLTDPSDRIALRAGNVSSSGRAQRALNKFAGDN